MAIKKREDCLSIDGSVGHLYRKYFVRSEISQAVRAFATVRRCRTRVGAIIS